MGGTQSQIADKTPDHLLSLGQSATAQQSNRNDQQPNSLLTADNSADEKENGPGTFEDLHKKCKDVFPVAFEGAKIVINKGLSNHFNIAHTITMSNLQPSGYRFGSTYVGTKQFSPYEAYPILVGEIDPSGNLNANILHAFSRRLKTKFQAQIQNSKWAMTQLTADYRGNSFTGTLTGANLDLINNSGIIVMQYLQNVSSCVALGSEVVYQYGSSVPGNQMAIYTLAGRYTGSDWQLSGNVTPMAAGVHVCFVQKVTQELQVGVEMEGSLRTQECTTTLGYQLELTSSAVTFKGQVDSNWCVGAVMEKRLQPMPFTLALSAFVNHVKGTYRFGVGFLLG